MKVPFNFLKAIALLILTSIFYFSSCGEDDNLATTYTVNYNVDDVPGVKIDIVIYEMDNTGKEVTINTMSDVKSGDSKKFTAQETTTNLILQYKWTIGGKTVNKLVVEKFPLSIGKNTSVNLTNSTKVL